MQVLTLSEAKRRYKEEIKNKLPYCTGKYKTTIFHQEIQTRHRIFGEKRYDKEGVYVKLYYI